MVRDTMHGVTKKEKCRKGAFLALAVEEAPVVNEGEEVLVVAVEEAQVLEVVVVVVEEAQVLELAVEEGKLIMDRHSVICVIQMVD